jgi:hypothetical protein
MNWNGPLPAAFSIYFEKFPPKGNHANELSSFRSACGCPSGILIRAVINAND